MEPLLHGAAPLSAAAAELLVGAVWKSVVLVAGVAALLRCVPRLSAAARSAVWTGVLLVTVLLPAFSRPAPAGPTVQGVVHASTSWSLGIAAVWLALSLLRLVQLGRSALRLRAIARGAAPVQASEEVDALLRRGPRQVRLCVSADVSRPSVAGFFRPRILLPVGLLEELSAPELEHVVLHEMEHLRRRDDWTNLLQKLSLALFPLHPALLWLDRRLCLERELACDDGVLRVTRARKAYAACLARLAEESLVRRGLSLALGLLGVRERRSELSGRVHRILRSPEAGMGRAQRGSAAAALVAGVLGGSMLLARSPQLISFSESGQAIAAVQGTAPALSVPPGLSAPTPLSVPIAVSSRGSAGKQTLVKAVMPQSAPQRMRTAVATRSRQRALRRVAANAVLRSAPAAPYVVFTEWQGTMSAAHLTLAVARDAEGSQQTYAAVPVRGGWLLIQL